MASFNISFQIHVFNVFVSFLPFPWKPAAQVQVFSPFRCKEKSSQRGGETTRSECESEGSRISSGVSFQDTRGFSRLRGLSGHVLVFHRSPSASLLFTPPKSSQNYQQNSASLHSFQLCLLPTSLTQFAAVSVYKSSPAVIHKTERSKPTEGCRTTPRKLHSTTDTVRCPLARLLSRVS